MNEKQSLSSEQIQARLKNLQSSASQEAGSESAVEITVASQQDSFNLDACQALLEEHGISSKVVGHGFHKAIVVSRDVSGRSIDVIALHRDSLVQENPLTASDFVVGIVAWAFGCGLLFPAVGGAILLFNGFDTLAMVVGIAILMVCSLLLGGVLGYLRCRAIASRRR